MATEDFIDMALLNPKQKAKAFKTAAKEIKSKDVELKLKALSKFHDCRYLTEGECIIPFIESIAVKKVH